MLKIRLARWGRHKKAFFRIVLTEHSKPANTGFKSILGWFDPHTDACEIDSETAKQWISKGAQPTSRVAKILFKKTADPVFQKFIVHTERTRKTKKEPVEGK